MRTLFAAALAASLAVPAWAEELTYTPDDSGGSVGTIIYTNHKTYAAPDIVTIQTSAGPVVFQHRRTSNGPDGCCADVLEVVSTPKNVIVRPNWVEVEEGGSVALTVMQWAGM